MENVKTCLLNKMKFRCQNCAREFDKNIVNDIDREGITCPSCESKKIRFAGAGFYTTEEKYNHIVSRSDMGLW